MFRKLYDVGSVWLITLIANVGVEWVIVLPMIRECVTILSVILAIILL